MIDHRLRQQQIVEREYLLPLAEDITHEQWHLGGKQRKWPVGSRYFFALQAVYRAPREEKAAAE